MRSRHYRCGVAAAFRGLARRCKSGTKWIEIQEMDVMCLYFTSYKIHINLINDKGTNFSDLGTLQRLNCMLAQIATKMATLTIFGESSVEVLHVG
jgi:hypothetical protein